jgi:hypothetical protein
VTREDDISNSVSVFIAPDKLITFSMEDRDANEFAIVLAGYYRLIVGKLASSTETSKSGFRMNSLMTLSFNKSFLGLPSLMNISLIIFSLPFQHKNLNDVATFITVLISFIIFLRKN